MSFGSFGSSKQAAPCMQARIIRAHLFYLGIDDFGFKSLFFVKNGNVTIVCSCGATGRTGDGPFYANFKVCNFNENNPKKDENNLDNFLVNVASFG